MEDLLNYIDDAIDEFKTPKETSETFNKLINNGYKTLKCLSKYQSSSSRRIEELNDELDDLEQQKCDMDEIDAQLTEQISKYNSVEEDLNNVKSSVKNVLLDVQNLSKNNINHANEMKNESRFILGRLENLENRYRNSKPSTKQS